ncbi:hypothetical protein Emed_004988 [Eimeria media]
MQGELKGAPGEVGTVGGPPLESLGGPPVLGVYLQASEDRREEERGAPRSAVTSCYKTHVATPCDGPAKQEESHQQQQAAASHPAAVAASTEQHLDEMHAAAAEDNGAEIEAGLHATTTEQSAQHSMINNSNPRELPLESFSSSSSSEEEGESDEVSSDDSDDSHAVKNAEGNVITARYKYREERKFDFLSAREQEKISEF